MNQLSATRVNELSVGDLTTGITSDDRDHTCVLCGQSYREGVIYPDGEELVDAPNAASRHVKSVHGGMLAVLLNLPKEVSGLTEIQRTVLASIAANRTDREIARELGGRAESTVRNHRFQLKKRITEARVLSALWELIGAGSDPETEFISYHADIPTDDERIVTTLSEARAILARYTEDHDGLHLTKFPKKEKEKLVLLRRVTQEFDRSRRYAEPEVNDILRPIYDDYVTIRRYLIEYRFLDRLPGGSEYWVNA
jgi:hypothetical protein